MPGFTGFVAILFSFNCQRRDYNPYIPVLQLLERKISSEKTQLIAENYCPSRSLRIVPVPIFRTATDGRF